MSYIGSRVREVDGRKVVEMASPSSAAVNTDLIQKLLCQVIPVPRLPVVDSSPRPTLHHLRIPSIMPPMPWQ